MERLTNKRVYISGKIGEEVISKETKKKFAKAFEMLSNKDNNVIDPAGDYVQDSMRVHFMVNDMKPSYDSILFYMIGWLRTCTCIYMLSDWQYSPGACAEFFYAKAIDMEIYFQDKEQALQYVKARYTKCPEGREYNEWANEKADEICYPI